MTTRLGLETEDMESAHAAQIFSNQTLTGMSTYSACYGATIWELGRQLGDGRPLRWVNSHHKMNTGSQLKGAGPTPYSRMADGRAVLRSSIRRIFSVQKPCTTSVFRQLEPSARARQVTAWFETCSTADIQSLKLARFAPEWPQVLFALHFEIFAARNDIDNLRLLTEFTIEHHFQEIGNTDKDGVIAFLTRCARKQPSSWCSGWVWASFTVS